MIKGVSLIGVLAALLLSAYQPVAAQMGMMGQFGGQEQVAEQVAEAEEHAKGLDETLELILKAQGAASGEDLDCSQVTDEQFEQLGEALMGDMHPDPEVHERMDAMMGGEGSETLRAAHINMGQRYLGCTTQIKGRGWKGFMGMMTPFASMMGGYGGSMGSAWFFWLTSWVLVNALLIALIRYFWKKGNGRK